MQRILAAVDGSDPSIKGVELAADLAVKFGAELVLLAVVPEMPDPGLDAYARAEHLRTPGHALPLAAGDAILTRARDRAVAKGAHRVVTEVELGDPAGCIIDQARDRKVDLIVIGSRGHGRLAGLMLGSVAQKVVSHAPCPVTVVR